MNVFPIIIACLVCILAIGASSASSSTSTNDDDVGLEREAARWRPVVLMHGLLASAEAMSHAQKWIEADFPGIYTHNAEIGNGRDDSMFMEINQQVDLLAKGVLSDPKLKDGFNIICHSQGGLLCRAFIERYAPPVYNFISWAGPMDGVYGVPDLNALCPNDLCPWLDWLMDSLMDGGWSNSLMQNHVAFSTYWKDPLNYDLYLKTNTFLADINNERATKNATYKANLLRLNKMALVYSTVDDIVVPRSSPWFQFYKKGSDSTIVPWEQEKAFQEDWIGLKTMNASGRLLHISIPCPHQDIPRAVCKKWYDEYTKPLLNNTIA